MQLTKNKTKTNQDKNLDHMRHLLTIIAISLVAALNAEALTPIAGLVTTGAAITLASSTTSKGKKKKHKKVNNRKKKKTSKKKKYRVSRYYEMGYDDGYDDGYNDGADGGAYEDDFYPSTRLRGKARCDYLEGYTEGYDDGFIDGRADYTGC